MHWCNKEKNLQQAATLPQRKALSVKQRRASADTTLLIMTIAAVLFVPVVLVYTIWGYRVFSKRINADAIDPDEGGLHPTKVRDSAQPEAAIGY